MENKIYAFSIIMTIIIIIHTTTVIVIVDQGQVRRCGLDEEQQWTS